MTASRASISRFSLPFFFLLMAVQAGAAAAWLAIIASDPKNRAVLGLSPVRLALLAGLVVAAAGLVWLAVLAMRPAAAQRWLDWARGRGFLLLFPATGALAVMAPVLLLVLRFARFGAYSSLYQRALPPLVFLALAGIELLAALAFVRFQPARFGSDRRILRVAAWAACALFALWALMAVTGFGLRPDSLPDGWGTPGVPLLEGQVVLAGLLAAVLSWSTRRAGPWAGGLLCIVLWLAAAGWWLAQPIQAGYFTPQPRPPTGSFMPYSDALTSGLTAQEITLGQGYNDGKVITRPFYVLVLAGLHALAGPQYERVIVLQTLLLAAFPVVLFLLGSTLHSRTAGIFAALLAVLREGNAIAATPFSGVSNSKLFMSDLPTALGLALVVLLVVLWLQQPDRRRWWPLLAGGVLGLVALIRLQCLLLAPVLLLGALPVFRRSLRRWAIAAALFAAGAALAVMPWVIRNTVLTGRVMLDQPVETQLVAGYYSDSGRQVTPRLPGEPDAAYSARLQRQIADYIRTRPLAVLQFVSAHALNNLVDTLLVLPLRHQPPRDLSEFYSLQNAFWQVWSGRVSSAGALLLAFYLLLIALGLGASWRRAGPAALLPLLLLAGYSLSGAVSRNSGWRYILPADWVGYFFAGLGLVQAARFAKKLYFTPASPDTAFDEGRFPRTSGVSRPRSGVLVAGLLLLAGSSLVISERIVPRPYPRESGTLAAQRLLAMPAAPAAGLDEAALERFRAQPGSVIAIGRSAYPRFYRAGEGEPGGGWALYQEMNFAHLSFFLIGSGQYPVVLPLASAPGDYPLAGETIVLGCAGRDVVNAWLVALPEQGILLRRGPNAPAFSCAP